MSTGFVTHPAFGLHDMGPGHPECPARLSAVAGAIARAGLDERVVLLDPAPAGFPQLVRVHDAGYVEAVFRAAPAEGLVHLDADTAMNAHSLDAALLAAGATVGATDRVIDGEIANAFCAVRPPGHHAEHNRAMGFCLFNNIAVAAAHALEHHGLERVAIFDFDVHHGNGTEDIFANDGRVLFCSSYQHPFYPFADPQRAAPNVVHAPLRAGSGSSEFRAAVEKILLPAMERFAPQMVFVSAGFDAHRDDPLASLALSEADYEWVTGHLLDVARRHAGGRLVSALEGGYDLPALGRCVATHLRALVEA